VFKQTPDTFQRKIGFYIVAARICHSRVIGDGDRYLSAIGEHFNELRIYPDVLNSETA